MHTMFVTGADGYAGHLLTQQLRQHGCTVVAGVRNRARKLLHERQFGKALVCDVSDPIDVARAIASVEPDGVVHLAGPSHAWIAEEEPLIAYQSLVTAWANVLDAVRRVRPRARVLLVSACDVYGNAGLDGRPLNEEADAQPVSTFGSLKLAAETIAHTFFDRFHLNLTIARPFHYLGAGQPDTFYFASAARQLAEGGGNGAPRTLTLPDLDCRRDLLHVRDVVDAYELLLQSGQPNETYNVSSGVAIPCREVVENLARTAGVAVQLVNQTGDGHNTPTAENHSTPIPVLCGDNEKLRELGWSPTHTVQGAIQDLMRSYQHQPAAQPA